jgi:hypothetical protein
MNQVIDFDKANDSPRILLRHITYDIIDYVDTLKKATAALITSLVIKLSIFFLSRARAC